MFVEPFDVVVRNGEEDDALAEMELLFEQTVEAESLWCIDNGNREVPCFLCKAHGIVDVGRIRTRFRFGLFVEPRFSDAFSRFEHRRDGFLPLCIEEINLRNFFVWRRNAVFIFCSLCFLQEIESFVEF